MDVTDLPRGRRGLNIDPAGREEERDLHYGGVLIAAGRWAEAEHELTTSLRHYDASYRALRSGSAVRVADLRLRQGRPAEGEELLTGNERDGYAVGRAGVDADRVRVRGLGDRSGIRVYR